MKDDSPTKEEILKCLTRSGYLLESRLVATLENNEFFVEPNQVILDENTGKSRELDIIAEKSIHALTDGHRDVSVRSFFIIEAINNKYPLILTTLREYNSNKPFELGETYWATPDEVSNTPEIGTRIDPENNGLYSQYCSITRKKNKEGELMASHSDDLYNSFSKMTHYCTTQINDNYDRKLKEGIWKLWYWRPILVLQNELMVLDEN